MNLEIFSNNSIFSRIYINKLSIINLFIYMYSIISIISCYLLPIPDVYKSFVSQPGLIFIPYLVGRPISFFSKKFLSINEIYNIITDFIVTWSLGLIFIMILEIILYVYYLFNISIFILIILIMSLLSIFFKNEITSDNINIIMLISSVVYGIFFSLFVTLFWNYPLSNANDYIRHTLYIMSIITNNRPLIFAMPYLPTMHTLYAIIMILFNMTQINEPLYLLWSSRFIFYPLYIFALFLLLDYFFKNKIESLIFSCVGSSFIYGIGGSIFTWETSPRNIFFICFVYVLYASLYLNKKIVGNYSKLFIIKLIIYIFSLFELLNLTNSAGNIGYEIGGLLIIIFFTLLLLSRTINSDLRWSFYSLGIMFTMLIFLHKIQGFLGSILILFFVYILNKFKYINYSKIKFITLTTIIPLTVIFMLFNFKIIPYPREPIINWFNNSNFLFGWDNIIMFIKSVYPSSIFILFIIGYIFGILIYKDKQILGISSFVSIIFIVYFTPIPESWRFLAYAHPFIIVISCYGFFKLIKIIGSNLKNIKFHFVIRTHTRNIIKFNCNNIKYRFLVVILLLPIGLNIYTHDLREFEKSYVIKDQERTQVFQVGTFIKDNVEKDVIAVGYIYYQYLASSYGLIEFINIWRNGEYRDDIIKEIYLANTAQEAYDRINDLLKDNKFFVQCFDKDEKELDRFNEKRSLSNLILLYDDNLAAILGDKKSVDKFINSKYFKLIYVTENKIGQKFYIFETQ